MKFKELTLRNFRSYGNNVSTVKLDSNKPTLIIGKNHDSIVDGQIDSNGSGKTSILDAIAFCCYDKTISGISKNDLINYVNEKNMEVSLIFEKKNKFYKIVRFRKNRALGGDGVKLYISDTDDFDDEDEKTKDSIASTNKEIESIIGIPFEIFSRIVIFSASHQPFLDLPFSHESKENQKDVIEELFGLTELTEKASTLRTSISSTKKEIESVSTRNQFLIDEISRQTKQIESLKIRVSDWENQKKSDVKKLKNEIKPMLSLDLELLQDIVAKFEDFENKLKSFDVEKSTLSMKINHIVEENRKVDSWKNNTSKKISDIELELKELKLVDIDYFQKLLLEKGSLELEILDLDRLKKTSMKELKSLTSERDQLGKEIQHLSDGTCPYCTQVYAESKTKMKSKIETLENVNRSIVPLENDLEKIIKLMNEKELEFKKFEDIQIPKNLDGIVTKIEKLEIELGMLQRAENPYTATDPFEYDAKVMEIDTERYSIISEMDSLKKSFKDHLGDYELKMSSKSVDELNGRWGRLESELETLIKSVNPYSEVLKEMKDSLDALEQPDTELIDNLDKRLEHQQFLLKLLTKKDSFIRKALLNKNIHFLNSRLAYYLERIGLNHKVHFTDEMVATISQFGTNYDFKTMSSGQKARINLALSFAFRDVLQSRFDKIDFYILDECLDVGLGNVGVTLAAKMIKKVAAENDISMFVISHRDEISSMFDKRLEIELRNGFSNIVE